jgi:hypothetical protein
MKILSVCLPLTMLLLLFINSESKAKTGTEISIDSAQTLETAKLLLVRMDEINALDKSNLAPSETKALRKELRMIKGELKELRKGTYMSVRTLVVIMLLPLIAFSVID